VSLTLPELRLGPSRQEAESRAGSWLPSSPQVAIAQGRGDTPNSSDGVVPYWSSHLDGAQSEKIVPSGHGSHQNIQGMEEIHRILILNLRTEK
jgi:hypothetical protein